jgi:hypothetical protein
MKTKPIYLLFLFCIINLSAFAQEPEVTSENESTGQNFALSADLVSSYVWRGQALSNYPNIQPAFSYTTNNGMFTLGSFSSYSFSDFYGEVDLYASLNLGMFTFEAWDYFQMNDTIPNRFFDYSGDTTMHALEGSVIFNGPESFPIKATLATFLYGNDKDENGDNYYSTYFELAYPFKWKKNNLSVFIGATPNAGLYASDFAINNIGITNEREIKINDHFSIPISGSLIVNPDLQNIYLVLTISLAAND